MILPVNLLFVCSQNKWRSPTGEALYLYDPRVKVRSAGTSASAKKKISPQNLIWADVVMENKHKKIIKGIRVTKTKGFSGFNLAAKYQRNYQGKSSKEPWYILTNLDN